MIPTPAAASPSLTLTAAELVALTDRDRPSAQARVLRAMGIPFGSHPIDGTIRVARAAALQWLGVDVQADSAAPPDEVNIAALKARRRAAPPTSAAA